MISYIYLLQDGNDKNTNIYKIGRTTQDGNDTRTLRRLKDYSQGTTVYNIFYVPNHQVCRIESHIKTVFKKKYILFRGTEWFEGNIYDMKKDIDTIIDDFHDELINDDDDVMNLTDVKYEDPKQNTTTNDYQDKTIINLQKQLQDAKFEIKMLQTSLHHLKHENEKVWEILRNLTAK